mmetsp:Transcript_23465/g.32125  ORF Transcript_23465/g.32125 Transcript_23465/m.32125 type:complete len:84 (+) Transcript_23465:2552-2803(+)
MFGGVKGLKSIVIPTSITSIGYASFVYNYNLTIVAIPTSVRSIGLYAFQACPSLICVQFNSTGVDFNETMTFDHPLKDLLSCS